MREIYLLATIGGATLFIISGISTFVRATPAGINTAFTILGAITSILSFIMYGRKRASKKVFISPFIHKIINISDINANTNLEDQEKMKEQKKRKDSENLLPDPAPEKEENEDDDNKNISVTDDEVEALREAVKSTHPDQNGEEEVHQNLRDLWDKIRR